MSYAHLLLAIDDRVATLTVNRPDRLNALDRATIDELDRAVGELVARDDVGGIVVTGAGRAFVAGADIGELAALSPPDALALSRRGQAVFSRVELSPKPVIAAVNGFALGGGCELALACHVRIAADTAKFGQPESKLGLIPGYGGTQRLPRLVGPGIAAQLMLTGELIDAAEALRVGLVNRVVPAAEVVGVSVALLRQILANAPLALAAVLDTMRRGPYLQEAARYELEAAAFAELAGTADRAEGTSAFLAKRPPRFTGR
jgi:enoyl-CoA hydratase